MRGHIALNHRRVCVMHVVQAVLHTYLQLADATHGPWKEDHENAASRRCLSFAVQQPIVCKMGGHQRGGASGVRAAMGQGWEVGLDRMWLWQAGSIDETHITCPLHSPDAGTSQAKRVGYPANQEVHAVASGHAGPDRHAVHGKVLQKLHVHDTHIPAEQRGGGNGRNGLVWTG